MPDSTPITPSPSPGPTPMQGTSQAAPPLKSPSGSPKTLTFLGMQFDEKQTKEFWNCILKTVGDQIQKEKAKSIKQIKNFGKDPSDPDYET